MKILITGAGGFIGQNLVAGLTAIKAGHDKRQDHVINDNNEDIEIFSYDTDSTEEDLSLFCEKCDFVFNLAGVNRPKKKEEFIEGNYDFIAKLLNTLKKYNNKCPIMLASSVQASLKGRYAGSEYGKSKKAGEELLLQYCEETGAKVFIYRFPNVFGKWCRPNYNSAIATFCNNIANGLEITVNDPTVYIDVVYIDDVIEEMIQALRDNANKIENGYYSVPVHYETTLGVIADTICSFAELQSGLAVPKLDNPLTQKLYATYLSYLPVEKFVYDLKMNCDDRGSFTEIIRTVDRGQFSVNVSKPGITKGNHWHHTKNEKFVVVSGKGLVRLRRIGVRQNGEPYPVHEFRVSGEKLQVIEMVPGYTHNIVNLSDTDDLITFMWANETFDSDKPDTFFERV